MSGIWLSRNELISTIGEIVGYKSGLAITRSELAMLVPSAYVPLWRGKLDAIIRVRPEEIGEIVGSALHSVGNTPTASVIFPGIRQWHKYRNDPISRAVVVEILGLLPVFLEKAREAAISGGRKIDPTPFLDDAEKIHGAKGREIALELLKDLELYQHQDPFSDFRRVAWRDLAELQDLFSSESLDTFYGTFIDQRYIDYLAKNFKAVDGINWRKFEALTCEFLDRAGFHVEIGKGRGDDNVDARVWPKKDDKSLPPTMLVQCKRERTKIGKVVVKALWADIASEHANSGLIVTTSALAPGAEKVCVARGYPIQQVNRETLRKWVEKMRTPSAGIVMGE